MKFPANNETVIMTRRYPSLLGNVLRRDDKIARKLILAWDVEKNKEKVLTIFLKEKSGLPDERYWELLRSVWIISGSLKNVDVFKKLMQSKRPKRYYFSTPEDAKNLRELPGRFIVFRAGSDDDNGISWTTSKEYAEFYQKEYKKEKVLTREINKSEVFAYIQRNREFEIIII
ncbi:MAG: hypothetical protein WC998_08180 [Candidatus Paceibacterota bacterium]|jgi:hypothetical protein